MKTRLLIFGAVLVAALVCPLSASAATLPFEIDLALPLGQEGAPFTRAYPGEGDGFGAGNQAVAVADFNGDGFDDYAVGFANYAPPAFPGASRGRVIIIYGGEAVSTFDFGAAGQTILINQDDNAQFGYSLATGDVTDDGLPDLVIGAPGSRSGKGVVMIIENDDLDTPGASFDVTTDQTNPLSGESRYVGVEDASSYGYSVACLDTTGDGAYEIAAGAPNSNSGAGVVYVAIGANYMSGMTLDITSEPELFTVTGGPGFGLGSALAAGDFDGNGISDLAVGAFDSSQVYGFFDIIPGPNTIDVADSGSLGSSVLRLTGYASLGFALAAGDTNADGFDDLLIGAPLYTPDTGREQAGAGFLIRGRQNFSGQSLDVSNSAVSGVDSYIGGEFEGTGAGFRLGGSVGLGDINGDGFADVLLGAPFAPTLDGQETFGGRVLAVYGGPFLTSRDFVDIGGDVNLFGGAANDFLGASLDATGDFNRDGIADFLMTAGFAPNEEANGTGQVHTLYGAGNAASASATFAMISGDTERQGLGGTLSPVLRVTSKFVSGTNSTFSGTLTRNSNALSNLGNGFGTNIAPVTWNLSTTRTGWTSVTLTFDYTDAEIAGFNESLLGIYQAPAVDGPWTRVSTQSLDTDANRFSITTNTLGHFAIVSEGPTLALLGNAELILPCEDGYEEPGYVATAGDGTDLTDVVVVGGEVPDPSQIGVEFIITYDVQDGSNVPAGTLTRSVTFVDESDPIIFLEGNDEGDVACGGVYVEPGFFVEDCETGLESQVVIGGDVVDPTTPGQYLISYDVTDSNGNVADTMIREVQVFDVESPVLSLVGDAEVSIPCNSVYVELGAEAFDSCDGDVSDSILVGGDVVDTSVAGVYTVNYNANDSNGNVAVQISRTVTVVGLCGVGATFDDCPNETTLFGQAPFDNTGPTSTTLVSEFGINQVFDNFSNVQEPIGRITWWGYGLDSQGQECARQPNEFSVRFYTNANPGNRPAVLLRTYTMTPLAEPTGFNDNAGREVLRYSATLNPPINLEQGWVSVMGLNNPDCAFNWYVSPQGDLGIVSGAGGNGDNPAGSSSFDRSRAFCLGPLPEGEGEVDGEGSVDGEGAVEGEGSADGEGQAEGEGELEDFLDCAPNSSFSQAPVYNGVTFPGSHLAPSQGTLSYAERFSGVTEGVGRVYWWGNEINSLPLSAFRINFYADGDTPGTLLYSFDVNAESVGTGRLRAEKEVIRYSANLPEEVLLTSGWISIGGTEEGKTFWLLFSSAGDQSSLYIDESGTVFSEKLYDPTICLLPLDAVEGEGSGEGEADDPQLSCPDGGLFSQPIRVNAGPATFSDTSVDIRHFDNFNGVSGTVGGVVWWGSYLGSTQSTACNRLNADYRIEFYEDESGLPGALVYSEDVSATISGTGAFDDGRVLRRFSAPLASPVSLTAGWISIVGINNPDCGFVWHVSSAGDGSRRQINGSFTNYAYTVAFCLVESLPEVEGEDNPLSPFEELLYTFASAETSGDRLVSLEEIQTQIPGFTQENLDAADANGDGLLSVAELLANLGNVILLSLDTNGDFEVSLAELLRVIQLYNSIGGYACAASPGETEDGYLARSLVAGDPTCVLHVIDQNNDREINLSELLRAIQFYNLQTYTYCSDLNAEDNFCPGS